MSASATSAALDNRERRSIDLPASAFLAATTPPSALFAHEGACRRTAETGILVIGRDIVLGG